MNAATLCTTLQQAVPPSSCARLPHSKACGCVPPMLYPNGSVVDVFVLERNDGFLFTDFGDALDWLG